MNKKYVAAVSCLSASVLTGCVPSLQYRLGQGFYSDTYAKTQVQAAAIAGKVKNLGHFSVDAGGCGNYSQDDADNNIVIPAIKSKLKEMGANVADNVVANEQTVKDLFLGFLIIPGLMACSNWTISGETLLVEPKEISLFKNAIDISSIGEPPMSVVFRQQ